MATSMKITITLENEDGEQIGYTSAITFERAVEEIYRLQRLALDKADVMAESLKEEGV